MKVRLSRAHFPVTVLGPGRRLGLWLQGCSIGCTGCISQDTWDKTKGMQVDVEYLVEACRAEVGNDIDGITITGGEPFEQPEGLLYLLRRLSDWRSASNLDILCYSGLSHKRLMSRYGEILNQLDGIVPEPYRRGRPSEGSWRGSSNQPVVPLTDLGRLRYTGEEPKIGRIQVAVTDGAVWFIGIPHPNDMERLNSIAASRGLVLEDVSWRT